MLGASGGATTLLHAGCHPASPLVPSFSLLARLRYPVDLSWLLLFMVFSSSHTAQTRLPLHCSVVFLPADLHFPCLRSLGFGCELVSSLALKAPAAAPCHIALFLTLLVRNPADGALHVASTHLWSLLCPHAQLCSLLCSFCYKMKSNLSLAPREGTASEERSPGRPYCRLSVHKRGL